jgi:hypothetical protein
LICGERTERQKRINLAKWSLVIQLHHVIC